MRGAAVDILARAFNQTTDQVKQQFTQGEIDYFYVSVVVPYCQQIEGSSRDPHPDSAANDQWRREVYNALVNDLRAGRVPETVPPGAGSSGGSTGGGGIGSPGGACPPGTFDFLGICWGAGVPREGVSAGSPRPGTPAGPSAAGFGGWVAVAGVVVLLVVAARR